MRQAVCWSEGGSPHERDTFCSRPGQCPGMGGEGARPEPPAGPAWGRAGPEVFSLRMYVCPASLQKRSRSSVGPQKELCFITFSGIWHKWKFRCVCDCIGPGIFAFRWPETEKLPQKHASHTTKSLARTLQFPLVHTFDISGTCSRNFQFLSESILIRIVVRKPQ